MERLRRSRDDAGFTLIELVITVSIMGLIAVALTGVVMMYMKTTVSANARMTESHDVQFAAAYWQRDVSSIGVRSTTYDSGATVHSYPLLQSVAAPDGGLAKCSLPSGTKVVTLAWSSYGADPDNPDFVSVTYVAQGSGTSYKLLRVRCTNSTTNSTLTVADNLKAVPTVSCLTTSGATTACAGTGANVPEVVKLMVVSTDLNNNDGSTYTATLTGERRET